MARDGGENSLEKPLLLSLSSSQSNAAGDGDVPHTSLSSVNSSVRTPARVGTQELLETRKILADPKSKVVEQHLRRHYLWEEYTKWRDQYHGWRLGQTKGAQGENTESDHHGRFLKTSAEDADKLLVSDLDLYPTVKTFQFRRTISFWAAIFCIEGCLLFLWIPLFEQISDYLHFNASEEQRYELTRVPNISGGTAFFLGIYMTYFELINMPSEGSKPGGGLNWICFDWAELRKTLQGKSGESSGSAAGKFTSLFLGLMISCTLAYMFGAGLYTVSQVSFFYYAEGSVWVDRILVERTLLIGGVLFFLGGIFEVTLNFLPCTPHDARAASLLNGLGGICFWLSAKGAPVFFGFDYPVLIGIVGTVAYLIGAIVALLMWRGEQFGGARIPVLNSMRRNEEQFKLVVVKDALGRNLIKRLEEDRPIENNEQLLEDVLSPKLSLWGLFFIFVYVLSAAIEVLDFATTFLHLPELAAEMKDSKDSGERWLYLSHLVSSTCNFVIVHMLLLLNSACPRMPGKDEQPYRFLMYMSRVVALAFLLKSLLALGSQLYHG